MISISELTVQRPDFQLGPLTLDIAEPITAVIGPNGSGKTTLIDALMGEGGATGTITWNGNNLHERGGREGGLRDLSYIPDSFPELFMELRPQELWTFVGSIRHKVFGVPLQETLEHAFLLAERLALDPGAKRHKQLSLGMKRKSQLVCGLMTRPKLLIVDEPQNGLDFLSSSCLRDLLVELVQEQQAQVLMSNHDLDSVARVAHRVIALRDGQCVLNVNASTLTGEALEAGMKEAFHNAGQR